MIHIICKLRGHKPFIPTPISILWVEPLICSRCGKKLSHIHYINDELSVFISKGALSQKLLNNLRNAI